MYSKTSLAAGLDFSRARKSLILEVGDGDSAAQRWRRKQSPSLAQSRKAPSGMAIKKSPTQCHLQATNLKQKCLWQPGWVPNYLPVALSVHNVSSVLQGLHSVFWGTPPQAPNALLSPCCSVPGHAVPTHVQGWGQAPMPMPACSCKASQSNRAASHDLPWSPGCTGPCSSIYFPHYRCLNHVTPISCTGGTVEGDFSFDISHGLT